MRILVDTHALIWFLEGNSLLSVAARDAIQDDQNERFFSHASAWEISIKLALGKLRLVAPYDEIFPDALNANGLVALPTEFAHYSKLQELRWHHRDPFDRLLIAQAHVENLAVVTRDPMFAQYGVQIIW